MNRLTFLVLGTLAAVSLPAQELGRSEQLYRAYLSETVRRGLPLLGREDLSSPYWPDLDRLRTDAASLEPGGDTDLVSAWMDLQQGQKDAALEALRQGWPHPPVNRLGPRDWGEALFFAWDTQDPEWTPAWLAWEGKAYSPRGLVRGIEGLEETDPSAVVGLLTQALELYPEDRRFLPLVARYPEAAVSGAGLIARDLKLGGWSDASLRVLLDRKPEVRESLAKAGYSPARLDAAQSHNYATWLASDQKQPPAEGEWYWDANRDGSEESRLVVQGGQLVSWSRDTSAGIWALSLADGKPTAVIETRAGATWTLQYEAYPWAHSLSYSWGSHRILYRFRPLAQAVPLWPEERFLASVNALPSVLADLWLPLDSRALAQGAASVETWDQAVRTQTVYLYRGQVWLSVEDTNRDGRDDTWSYFRSGALVSVYRDLEGTGTANLRELYEKGLLDQVQVKAETGRNTEFVLFPEGVQLWDPHGQQRPLERLFLWPGQGRLTALVFSGSSLPWNTMPQWEPRP